MRGFLGSVMLRLALLLCVFPAAVSAQNQSFDGVQIFVPEQGVLKQSELSVKSILELMRRGRRHVCVTDKRLAACLRREGVRSSLIAQSDIPSATLSGKCDLLLQGAKAAQMNAYLCPEVVTPIDRERPVIHPDQKEFSSNTGNVEISAKITDNTRVASAFAVVGRTEVPMHPQGNDRYSIRLKLPPDYDSRRVQLRAKDTRGNAAQDIGVFIRRVPLCGAVQSVSLPIVKQAQRHLKELQRYSGDIDGLAGPNTCDAIGRSGIDRTSTWPQIVSLLDAEIAKNLIYLRVTPPTTAKAGSNTIGVSVIDPRNTGLVRWVRMLVDGALVAEQQSVGSELAFQVGVAEGATSRITFRALNARRTEPLAEQSVSLTGPARLRVGIYAPELTGGRIASEAAQVRVSATLDGAQAGRVFYAFGDGSSRDFRPFTGAPVSFDVTMPPPGETTTIVFWAESGDRTATAFRVQLQRIKPPVVMDVPPERSAPPAADEAPDFPLAAAPVRLVRPVFGTNNMTPDRVPEGVDKKTPPPPAPPPSPQLPPWLIPAAIGALVVLGLVATMVSVFKRIFRQDQVASPAVAATLRVTAVPDPDPAVEVIGADLPGLVLTVEPGVTGASQVEFYEENQEAAQ